MTDLYRGTFRIVQGDVARVAARSGLGTFDAVLCDPPYGLKFMGKAWDHGVPSSSVWANVLDRLRPGGHLIAFGGTRTFHRLGVAIEDAGFEIRDCLSWLYGQGFPKSLDVSKAIDKAAGVEGPEVGRRPWLNSKMDAGRGVSGLRQAGSPAQADPAERVAVPIRAPATEQAHRFHGYGTALKPAWEPAVLAMKPTDGTFAANAVEHGVAGLAVDAGRIQAGGSDGRWPANVLLDEDAAAGVDGQSGVTRDGVAVKRNMTGPIPRLVDNAPADASGFPDIGYGGRGGASRFFYTAKASPKERHAGLDKGENKHPTLKPVRLAEYLAKLLLPPAREDGQPRRILVPFSGVGSEVAGCLRAGWDEVVGIELEPEYVALANRRVPALLDL